MVDLKFDALYTGNLHREPLEVGLLEKLKYYMITTARLEI